MGIRQTLGLPILDLLAEFILLGKPEKNEILEHQAKLLALYRGQQERPDFAQKDLCKVPRYGKGNNLMLEAEMARLGVTAADVKEARSVVVSRVGMPPDVPLIGKIATDLEYIENDFLEALVKGQSGEAILRSVAKLGEQQFDHARLKPLVIERHDKGQIARHYIGKYDDDSDAVISAQACQHLVDLCVVLFDKENAPQTQDWQELCNIFEVIGYVCLQAAADHLAALGHLSDARDIYQELPEDIDIELHNDALEGIKTLLQDRTALLLNEEKIDDNIHEMLNHLLKKRFEQIDLSTLLNIEGRHEDLDLKERLRMRLSALKE